MRLTFDRRTSFGTGIPIDDAAETLADSNRASAEMLERAKSGAAAARGVLEAHRERLRALLGSDAGAKLPDVDENDPKDRRIYRVDSTRMQYLRAERARQREKLLAQRGVSAEQLESLGKQFNDEMQRALPTLPTLGDVAEPKVIELKDEADLPDHIRDIIRQPPLKQPKPKPPNPWTCFHYSPHMYPQSTSAGWTSDGAVTTYDDLLNAYLMMMGQSIELHGDDIGSQLEAHAQIGFRYKVPEQGRLEIVVHVAKQDYPDEWADSVVAFKDTSVWSSFADTAHWNQRPPRHSGGQTAPESARHRGFHRARSILTTSIDRGVAE